MKTSSLLRKIGLIKLMYSAFILLMSSFVFLQTNKWTTAEYPEPALVKLTAEEADKLIEQEWLAQLGEKPFSESSKEELIRIHRILERQSDGLSQKDLVKRQKQIAKLEKKLRKGGESKALYLEIRRLKREILLADPQIDFSGIVCIDNPYPHGESDQVHEVRSHAENFATTGGRLLVLEGLGPDANVRKLAPQESAASFWRPNLSFDGKKVLFSMKEANKPSFNLYEIGTDGEGFRQITESDYNDYDPIYAPDGNIIFTTSRCNQYLRCGSSGYRMFTLARCDKNGENIYFISANNEADFTPTFLNDGRILYTRWEYIDKNPFRVQKLWTINPDGTNDNRFWGNQSYWPDLMLDAHPIPNTNKVLFTAAGHHDIYTGPLGIVNNSEGTNYPDGLYKLSHHLPWGEVGKGPEDKVYNKDFSSPECYMAFQTSFPVSEDLMLVSARKGTLPDTRRDPELPWFDLYLMDYDGNMELLYKGSYNILYAQPIRSRKVPRVIPSTVKWSGKMQTPDQQAEWGTLYSSDVYEGSGIPRGMVKKLRILEVESQTYGDGTHDQHLEKKPLFEKKAMPDFGGWGETVVSLVTDDATKRIWGTVPVESDGSVHFKVPPVKGIYFQLLDEKGRALQTMRSFTHVMPGEVRGCVGCHETRSQAPAAKPSIATRRAPSEITSPLWGDATISFPRFVQPVLNKNCVSCHGGDEPKGGLDLTHRSIPGTWFTWPYVSLVFGDKPENLEEWVEKSVAGCIVTYHPYPGKDIKYPTPETVIPPMTALSYRSKLIELAASGKHHDVKVTSEEEQMLIAWVDANCPFLGLEEIMAMPNPDSVAYLNNIKYKGLSYPAMMRTAPFVHKEFMQDDFRTQSDRIPKDEQGNDLPAFELKDGKRIYRIPEVKKTIPKN